MNLAERIRQLEAELARLKAQQRAEFVMLIATIIGPGVLFSAAELWAHQAVSFRLAVALEDAGVSTVRQLGKRLRQYRGAGLERVGADEHGAIWVVP